MLSRSIDSLTSIEEFGKGCSVFISRIHVNGVLFFNKRHTKEVASLSNWHTKGEGLNLGAEVPRKKTF